MIEEIQFTSDFWCIVLPIILCFIDVITGYVNAWRKNKVSSKKMRNGLSKKFGEMVLCFLGWLFYLSFGIKLMAGFISAYISLMEVTSIFENLANLGVPIPNIIKSKVNNLKEDLDKEE